MYMKTTILTGKTQHTVHHSYSNNTPNKQFDLHKKKLNKTKPGKKIIIQIRFDLTSPEIYIRSINRDALVDTNK